MTKQLKLKATRLVLAAMILLLAFGTLSFAQGQRYKSADAWSFGVQGDTQWTITRDAANPNYVAGSILTQVNQKMIDHGVRFTIAVGDLSDRSRPGALVDRAKFNEPLFDAGIGNFPMRGNHESYAWIYNYSTIDATTSEFLNSFQQTQGTGPNLFGASNFSSPDVLDGLPNTELAGLSYSFDYGTPGNDVRFVILDTQTVGCSEYFELVLGGTTYKYWPNMATCRAYAIPAQQEWINGRLDANTRNTSHAIVLSHQPPMAQEHTDTPFGGTGFLDYNDNGVQDAFYDSLSDNGVRYYHAAHDHIHHRSFVKSPNGNSQIHQIISAGLSTKFYEPAPIPSLTDAFGAPTTEDQWHGQKTRETPISQEVNNIGYYVYTIDGPRVTVDYYSDERGDFKSGSEYPFGAANKETYPLGVTPTLNFKKKETFGYSLNGQEFIVAQGGPYSVVEDSDGMTTARILDGTNNSTATDHQPVVIDDNETPENPEDDFVVSGPRPFVKAVNTGWTTINDPMLASNILSLWGMEDFGSISADTYVLSMTYNEKRVNGKHLGNGGYRLAGLNSLGQWVNAVDLNIGKQKKKFVKGSYKPEYGLGTYGIDQATGTVWAVINYNADFAVYKF